LLVEIKILLIEDNPADARLIKESFRDTQDHFHLDWKEKLSSGILFLEEIDVDAILVDLNLPDSRGLETFTKINEKFSEKPIIVLTGLNDKEMAYRAVREGAQDYLIKGEMDGVLLGRCIRYSIERKKNEIALREANQAEQASKTLYKQVVSMISDIVWRYDVNSKGKPVGSYISPVADRMLGLPDGTIGDSFDKYFSYVHPDDLPALQKMLAEGIQKLEKDKTAEYRLQKADGTKLWVRSRGSAYGQPDGRVEAFGTTSDITEYKYAADELQLANKKLQLLSSITRHDILNQITVLQLYLELAKDHSLDTSSIDYLEKLESATKEIQRHVEFTRQYEKPKAVKPSWQAVSGAILRASSGKLPVRDECRGLFVYADPMLEKVFSNLMDNTVRHGEHSTLVHTYYRTFAKDITIIWEDDGIGIPDDEKKKIFLRGFGKNTGVGLFLCKESLSITGIEIKETGTYGEGARFEITVPYGMWRTIGPDER
jgi:PAS domain S-box-containing protein